MSFTYAIPDIHGRLDLLEAALEMIVQHVVGDRGTIVTLGDYVDRGPHGCQVIERLMCWNSDRLALVCLKGNHEAMMWGVCNNFAELSWWLESGGKPTLASYGSDPARPSIALPQTHLDWIAALPLVHADKFRVYVHAGVDPATPLDKQTEQTALWMRYPRGYNQGYGRRHVVHGHQANIDAPVITGDRTNLDGMAWKTGRLVIGVFNDERPGTADQYLEVVAAAG